MEFTIRPDCVALEGAWNFRDIGGYGTKDGRRVRKGLLYRSDELCYLTDRDISVLKALGIRTIIDYRARTENAGKEDRAIGDARICYMDPKADVAAMASSDEIPRLDRSQKLTARGARALMIGQNEQFVLAESSREVYSEMLHMILKEENLPLVQHCRGGKDRTGYGIALILLLLGVEEDTVIQDYMYTNVCKKEKNEKSLKKLWEETKDEDLVQAIRYMKEADEAFLGAALRTIRERYGTAEQYALQELSMTLEDIEKLREMFLVS